MQVLLRFLNAFFEVAIFRRGPQDLPASQALLVLTVVVYWLVTFGAMTVQLPSGAAMLQAIADTALMIGFTWALLAVRSHLPRFSQTLTALAGTGTLLGLVALPVLAWLMRVADPADQTSADPSAVVPSLLLLFLMGWSIAVVAFILRHALDVQRSISVVLAVAYLVLSFALSNALLARGGAG